MISPWLETFVTDLLVIGLSLLVTGLFAGILFAMFLDFKDQLK